jgi:hypothetical protein
MATLEELIALHNKPHLADADAMVYQVWDDGEITLQKSGSLLWQRSLHSISQGNPKKRQDRYLFPEIFNDYGYLFTDKEGAEAINKFIMDLPNNTDEA